MKKIYQSPETQSYILNTKHALLSGSKVGVEGEETGKFPSRYSDFDEDDF